MKNKIILVLAVILVASTQAFGLMSFRLEDPIPGLLSNSVTQILYDGEYVWLATGNGLSGSTDGGATWITFNKDNAFGGSGISAMALSNDRFFVATADIEAASLGTGLYYTDNSGGLWNHVNNTLFESIGKIAYDIAVFDSVAFSTNWNGGLLRSLDDGLTWHNIFIDRQLDSLFEVDSTTARSGFERGRYFSGVIDPFHDDTTIVWAGSAEGVQRLYYIGKHKKLASLRINDIANDGDTWWYATDRGVSKFNDTLLIFNTYDTDNGFPANFVSAIAMKGNLIVAGLYDTLTQNSLGFAVSSDAGASWSQESPAQVTGANRKIEDIKFFGDEIWVACNTGGLVRSTDGGNNWARFYPPVDDSIVDMPFHHIHGIDVATREEFSRIAVGTDSGIVALYFDGSNDYDSAAYLPIFDNTLYSQKVVSLSSFPTQFGDEYWACVRPARASSTSPSAVIRSTDNGFTWIQHLTGPPAIVSNQIEIGAQFGDTTVWVATDAGLRFSNNFGGRWDVGTALDRITGRLISGTAPFLSVRMGEFETNFGSFNQGLAQLYLFFDGSQFLSNFRVHQPNLDKDQFDFVGRSYTATGQVPGDSALAGNFVVAMGLQRTGDSTLIWASHRPALEQGMNGVSITTDRGLTWRSTLEDTQVWNFEFNGDTAFAAASQGLFMSTDFGENWDQISIVDPETGRSISDSVEVYAITLIGDEFWVGTDDGVAKSSNLVDWTILREFLNIPDDADDETRSFITPNPFSPYLGGSELKFHYKLKQPGNVTITIYDFANNIVKKVIDGVARDGDVQYDDLDTWNGTNTRGDPVAAGVYLYLLESTGGEKLWGKIMVIP